MAKRSLLFFQTLSMILAVLFLWYHPLPFGWMNVVVYAAFIITGTLLLCVLDIRQKGKVEVGLHHSETMLDKLNSEVQVASSQVAAVSEHINITLEENHSFASQVFDKARDMAELNTNLNKNMHNTIAEVKKLIDMLVEGENTAACLKNISAVSNEVIKKSLDEILEIVDNINQIRESSVQSARHMELLINTSGDVVKTLETVNNIAKQTHLLALNASIESARAGEMGKGFAVVADEIRKLALDSTEAVKGINALIKGIEVQATGANSVVRQNSERVEKGVRISRNIEKNLENINTSFSEVLQMIDSISDSMQKEMKLTAEVEENIGSVENTVLRMAESVEQVVDSVHRQKQGMKDMALMGNRLDDASKSLVQLFDSHGVENIPEVKDEVLKGSLEQFRRLVTELNRNRGFLGMQGKDHEILVKDIIQKNDFIEAIWTNDGKGRFLCSIPEAGIANGMVREWFKKAITGEEYVSAPYISAITKNPCVTISAPIKDAAGNCIGVIGIDVKL